MSDQQGVTPETDQAPNPAPSGDNPPEGATPDQATSPDQNPPGGNADQPSPTPGTSDEAAPQAPAPETTATAGDPTQNPIPAAGEGAVPETVEGDDEETQFRNEQLAAASAQGVQGDQAVPEVRPQASQVVESAPSPLTQKMQDAGLLNTEAMPKSAYDAANDDARKEETASQGVSPTPHAGDVIEVTSGVFEGRRGAVLRIVSHASIEDQIAAQSGNPAQANYARPAEIEVAFRGDDRDGERLILDVVNEDSPYYAEYKIVPTGFAGRGAVTGSL